jgi:uncharacterized protein (TIGR02145 family)
MKTLNNLVKILLFSFLAFGCSKNDKGTDPVTDIDGNTYKTVRIGTQIWMSENLKTSRLNDGTEIPVVKDVAAWTTLITPAYCWYNNNEIPYRDEYGALYNGYTVLTGKVCPDDWHIPSNAEWTTLTDFLGDPLKAGGKLKEAGTTHWLSPSKGENSAGFTALPGGLRYFEGTFASEGTFTGFWSQDLSDGEEWYIGLYHANTSFTLYHQNIKNGFSIRCLKN